MNLDTRNTKNPSYQPMGVGLLMKALQKKISNQITKKVRLNIATRGDFLERNIKIEEGDVDPDAGMKRIWDTTIQIADPQVICEGKRTPFKRLLKENNQISEDMMQETNGVVYIGCKDGKIRAMCYNSDTPIKQWIPHQGSLLKGMQLYGSTLVTLAAVQNVMELKVWDVKDYTDSIVETPQLLGTLLHVQCFQITNFEDVPILHYLDDCDFKQVPLDKIDSVSTTSGEISKDMLLANVMLVTPDRGIFYADKDGNIKQRKETANGEDKVILPYKLGLKVKGMVQNGRNLYVPVDNKNDHRTDMLVIDLELEGELMKQWAEEDEERMAKLREQRAKEDAELEEKEKQENEDRVLRGLPPKPPAPKNDKPLFLEPLERIVDNVKTVIYDKLSDCSGMTVTSDQRYVLINSHHGIAIYEDFKEKYVLRTEFHVQKAVVSSNERYILAIGQDGALRMVDWLSSPNPESVPLRESRMIEAVTSKDGQKLAILSEGQGSLSVYNYEDMVCTEKFDGIEDPYIVSFTSDSKHLILVNSTHQEQVFVVTLVNLNKKCTLKIRPITIKINEDYISQVEVCMARGEIYTIQKTGDTGSSLIKYDLQANQIGIPVRDVTSLCLSPDEKLLAYCTKTAVVMEYVEKCPHVEVNEIPFPDEPVCLCFYNNGSKIVVQTKISILVIDVYTHEICLTISSGGFVAPMCKVSVIDDDFIAFVDNGCRLCVYDAVNHSVKEMKIATTPLVKSPLRINDKISVDQVAWACVGNHLVFQTNSSLEFRRSPFLHHTVTNQDSLLGPYDELQGLFTPLLLGGPTLHTGSYADIFNEALEDQDTQTLATPIFPYKITALHFFAMSCNADGVQYCFAKKLKYCADIFGKTPLDYAVKSGDRVTIDIMLEGIYTSDPAERDAIMRNLPLSTLLENNVACVAPLLNEGGASRPIESKFCGGTPIPSIFQLKNVKYGESGYPFYSREVANQLHPESKTDHKERTKAIATFVLTNPLPANFTDDSVKLLSLIQDHRDDEVVKTKSVSIFLNRKWNHYGFAFYFAQFVSFLIMIATMTAWNDMDEAGKLAKYTAAFTSVTIASYFLIYELIQMVIQKEEYFQSPKNMVDVARLTLIFSFFADKFLYSYQQPPEALPICFFLMWLKVLSYLTVFKPTRYLIMMIFEIISDISTFLIILFIAVFAYGQIQYTLADGEDQAVEKQLANSYGIAYGDFDSFRDFNQLQFIIFMFFTFFIPLVLMNMLIAIMSDSYARVQTNSAAADAKSLAEMLGEIEEITNYFLSIFRPSLTENKYYFCFSTNPNDGEDEAAWEGTVGQLKNTIEETCNALETRLIQAMNESFKENTTKVLDTVNRNTRSELDSIDTVHKTLEKETNKLSEQVDRQTSEEAQKVRELLEATSEEHKAKLENVGERVMTTSNKIIENVHTSAQASSTTIVQSIDTTSEKETTLVSEKVREQTLHHKEMVEFTTKAQVQVKTMLEEGAAQSAKLLDLVNVLQGIQKDELELIHEQRAENARKKEVERYQRESLDKIQADLVEIHKRENKRLEDEVEARAKFEAQEKKHQDALDKIQQDLDNMKVTEEDRNTKTEEERQKNQDALDAQKLVLAQIQNDLTDLQTKEQTRLEEAQKEKDRLQELEEAHKATLQKIQDDLEALKTAEETKFTAIQEKLEKLQEVQEEIKKDTINELKKLGAQE